MVYNSHLQNLINLKPKLLDFMQYEWDNRKATKFEIRQYEEETI